MLRRLSEHVALSGAHALWALLTNAVVARFTYQATGDNFGLAVIATTGMTTLNLFDEGLGSYAIRRIALARRSPSAAETSENPLGAFLLASVVSSLLAAIGFAVALRWVFSSEGGSSSSSLLAAAGLLAASASAVGARILEGCEAYRVLRAIQIAANTLLAAALWLATRTACSLDTILSVHVLAHAVRMVACLHFAQRALPVHWVSAISGTRRQQLGELVRFIRPITVSRLVSLLSYRLDLWFVQVLLGPSSSAAYAIAQTISGTLLRALDLFKATLPVSVLHWRSDDIAWRNEFVLIASKFVVLILGLTCLAFLTLGRSLIRLWFGNCPPDALIATNLLVAFVATVSFRSVAQTILVGQGKFLRLERVFVLAGAINVASSLAATVYFGTWGPAFGSLVAGTFLLLATPTLIESELELRRGLLFRRLIVPAGALFTACGGVGYAGTTLLWSTALSSATWFGAVALCYAVLFTGLLLWPLPSQWFRSPPSHP